MTRRLLSYFALLLAGVFLPAAAFANTYNLGYVSFDVTASNANGPTLAEFDIVNLTGANEVGFGDPADFPIANQLTLTNLSVAVTYAGGQTKVFGSSYFTLDADGESFDGTATSMLNGYPLGFSGAVSATLTGTISTPVLTLVDGTSFRVYPSFSATISDAAGLSDGDLAVISATTAPEPSALILAATGLAGLWTMRRKLARGRGVMAVGIACVALLGAARSSSATVSLAAATSPTSGASGVTALNVTGSGFPSGTVTASGVTVTVAAACGSAGTPAQVNSVTTVIGTSKRVQFVVPGGLSSGTYYVSLSGATAAGTAFASGNCSAVSVTGASSMASLSASAITFSSMTAGTTSGAQSVVLTNTGSAALNVSGITVTGTGANLFGETDNCVGSIAVGAYCTINATFKPKIAGSYSAAITISDDASPATQSVSLGGTATAFAITIDTTNASDWKINNGALTLDFIPSKTRISGIHLAGYSDNLVDTTNSNAGIYMDNSGFGSGTTTTGYVNAGTYLDWWVTVASGASNAYTYSTHFVVTPNDPGIHLYFVAVHKTTDIAGGVGQVQWVYRSNLADFPNTYSVNADLSNPGPVKVPLPPASESFSTDPGRAVSDATVDLHGFTLPPGFTREFYTKYDYASYNYLHQAHGTYGNTFGTWAYFPSNESLVAGPTKQNLIFTGNLLILEAFSNHYDNSLSLATAAGTASSRLFGPFYVHFNTIGQAYDAVGTPINTPDDMYADAVNSGATAAASLYDNEVQLAQAGYVASTARGTATVQVNGVTGAPKTAWAVLSDPAKNIQFSSQGYQYWADISSSGTATFTGVVPGTYRLTVYDLGQWGELRQDGIVVSANQNTAVPPVTFVPENFGGETVFTIGTPDRSSHEFLHGHDAAGHDDKEFFGASNYWADFAANSGAVVYNATTGPNGPATNDLTKWNYNHWGVFDPGLYGGVYNSSDDTTDGYTYAIPTYVKALAGSSGTNGVTTRPPAWQVHFASPADVSNYQYAVFSIAMACDYGSYVLNLNGTSSSGSRTWSYSTATYSDCAVRSGLSGYTQWIAFQYPISVLKAAGQDNVLSLGVSQTYGVMDDAIRLELSNTGAAPSVTGWNDYHYVSTSSSSGNIPPNDALPNP